MSLRYGPSFTSEAIREKALDLGIKSHAAALRMPKKKKSRSHRKTGRRPSFDGRVFSLGVPYGEEWNRYLQDKVHDDCKCYKLDNVNATFDLETATIDPETKRRLEKILTLKNRTQECFLQYKKALAEIDRSIVLLLEQRDSVRMKSLETSFLYSTIETLQTKRKSISQEFEKMNFLNGWRAMVHTEFVIKQQGLDACCLKTERDFWPYASFEDLVKQDEKEAKRRDSETIKSMALLFLRLRDEEAICTEDGTGFKAERYSVHLTETVIEFATIHEKEITKYMMDQDMKDFEQHINLKAKRLALCEKMKIDPEAAIKYAKHMDCITKYSEKSSRRYRKPTLSLTDSLSAAIERDKNPSSEYELWRTQMANDETRNSISDEVHEQVWGEFFAPVKKWKKTAKEDSRLIGQTIGTVEGFDEWRTDRAASPTRRRVSQEQPWLVARLKALRIWKDERW